MKRRALNSNKWKLLISLLLLTLSFPAISQLTLGAELRPRALLNLGYATPIPKDAPPRMYVSQRTRLNAGFKKGPIETYISFQDVRLWGSDNQFKATGAYGNTGSMSLYQGWFRVNPLSWLSLKVGRQIFKYDDQRILATRGWNDSQVTYDAVLFQAVNESHTMDLGLSWNAQSSRLAAVPPQKFRTLDFLRYQRSMEKMNYSFISLVTGNYLTDTTREVRYRATWGANLDFSASGFTGRGSLYYQHHLNGVGGKVSAFCASVILGIPLMQERAKLSAGLDYVSGQDGVSNESGYQETQHAFDLLYGTRHTWYGYLDYFSNMPAQGLQDYMLKGDYKGGESLLLQAHYHYFRLAARMPDPELPATAANSHLAHELDLKLKWTIAPEAVLEAGYCFMVPGETLEILKGVEDTPIHLPQFFYVMITIKPSFTLQ